MKGQAVSIVTEQRSYVAGRWVDGDEVVAVENPADETTVAEISVTPIAEVARGDRRGPAVLRRR